MQAYIISHHGFDEMQSLNLKYELFMYACLTAHPGITLQCEGKFFSIPEESHLFLSLQLGDTNRPVMQQ